MEVLDKTKELETRSIKSLLRIYALPAVISQIIASVYNMVDRVFIGNGVGDLAIAGLAITLPIMNIIHAFGSLVGAGAASRMSIVLGRKDMRWAEKILGNSMLLSFFFGFLFVTGGYLFMDNILTLFGATAQTIAYAREYMMVVLPGMFLTTLTFNLTGLIRASGYPTKSMFILAGAAVLNTILDPIFIFSFGWGIAGAAWATTISMAASSVAAVWHFGQPKSFIRFKRHGWAPKLYIFKNITMIGLSPFLMNVAAAGVVALLNKQLIRYGGDLAVSAYGMVNTYGNLLVLFMLGVCQGMQPIAGYNYGAGHSLRLKEVYRLTMKVCVAVGCLGTVLCLCIPRYLMMIFGPSEILLNMAIPATRFLLIMAPLIGFTITNSQFFQSIDKPWIAIVTSLSRQVLFLIPMMFLMPMLFVRMGHNGLTGVWCACTVCDVLGSILAAFLFMSQRKLFRPGYIAPIHKPRKEAGPDE